MPVISVVVNGAPLELDGPTRLTDYLKSKGLAERRLAVAVNGVIVRREDYDGVTIGAGDRIEIVRPAGGG
jgi:sulfur carrier protein